LPFVRWSALEWFRRASPARRPSAGAVPGRRQACRLVAHFPLIPRVEGPTPGGGCIALYAPTPGWGFRPDAKKARSPGIVVIRCAILIIDYLMPLPYTPGTLACPVFTPFRG